jgi:hypothetical protein
MGGWITTYEEYFKTLGPERQSQIKNRYEELIAPKRRPQCWCTTRESCEECYGIFNSKPIDFDLDEEAYTYKNYKETE